MSAVIVVASVLLLAAARGFAPRPRAAVVAMRRRDSAARARSERPR